MFSLFIRILHEIPEMICLRMSCNFGFAVSFYFAAVVLLKTEKPLEPERRVLIALE